MLTRFIIFITVLLPFYSPQAQTTASHKTFVKRVTKQIAYVGLVKCILVSKSAYTPKQYLRFDSLRNRCTSAELTALLKHRSPAVRVYSFRALSEKPEVDLLPLLVEHQSDTAEYAWRCACAGGTDKVVDGMLLDYKGSYQYTQDTLVSERKILWEGLNKEYWKRFDREFEREEQQREKQQTEKQEIRSERRENLNKKRLTAHDDK
ncbi:hypothetical protein D0N36_02405 [Hymenobacter lapidiphilus]|uniref:hypothetical protein n=1 Tax=Hymenobacter sp. CCM 8763 TaxID=2303334 RepID=UPI000E340A23|nr:hypothetical protein [Hymenobacter sp. CCM 8763]RFP66581.1 hypothetical protein D0N36_02405 [Hymenobacter sp. CCM 8763]